MTTQPLIPRLYRGRLIRWVDGDTFDADIFFTQAEVDLGFYITAVTSEVKSRIRFRLFGYEAPEDSGSEREMGLLATNASRGLCPEGTEVTIASYKGDKYGRWLADVTLLGGLSLVKLLLSGGWGLPWDGKGDRPFFSSDNYPIKS